MTNEQPKPKPTNYPSPSAKSRNNLTLEGTRGVEPTPRWTSSPSTARKTVR
ncbi:hypothetical protein NE236_14665 [Actinoallomurus purpureus]|uniref:hypothetical protein n=1 Tax=Actinoallomurus purpureus TaxID=478114 RepID=UPI0020933039|nr:hypothetical protein [Actinoallomurus purpureus]MCO6006233.1 hypothetical protein [Actinoallomurus purpureus]